MQLLTDIYNHYVENGQYYFHSEHVVDKLGTNE